VKVALVHDYLVDFGGGERVLLALHEIWPEAPLYVAVADRQKMGRWWKLFSDWDIKSSWFQKLPGAASLISPLRFLLPFVWESFDFSQFDLVISSSAWGMSKSVVTRSDIPHLCYCHTPPRFLYGYPQARKWGKHLPVRVYSFLINHFLRLYDYAASQRVDQFVANSKEVAARIRKFYRRDCLVVHPPVDLPSRSSLKFNKKKGFYLYVGRLVSYKHPDLAVEAFGCLRRKLLVVGRGPLAGRVKELAQKKRSVRVLGAVSDRKLSSLYRSCRALVFPVEQEDFGIVPLEAQAFGKPVIALRSGGAKETVLPGKTGVFFEEPTVKSLQKAILEFEKKEDQFDPRFIRRWAEGFSKQRFKEEMRKLAEELVKNTHVRTTRS
jgi:glycosyltransferase involved in cell wall biosynthesis